ncbi:LOG family protein [Marinomonas mediterranea]|jgi:conserved hypothetical protein, DprA/Smf-related, family 2|uniref:Cytokinin riboside 5'-monophosphate phosphoribohydrolase n=1 Tax=Marinomonas mediterranea (strain ATCC 700492 / JCM 21426 / NBRC 103028 / MMB-1) TaxID=717774 RepID=F2JWS2_MARM1|nr:TIGR00730 family Rossman fold protein [Marinomonas mediterranea]ADZ92939.1 Conserved hypothetical protein CHP00730 [Marinomonas mediterranea MMB-1]WCN18960.1 TIGR00730 family Rossman fold protein [Marinomonas mediterranea MMB-1]
MKVAVFCGSSLGHSKVYERAVAELGAFFAENGIEVVYGGGHVGLMGVIANAVLAAGGKVTGVIPTHLEQREIAHPSLTELHVVTDMHERKAKMADLADAFVALPGGVGTLEEIFEVYTWAQIGLHKKPCAFYNVDGYYDLMFEMIVSMHREGFVKKPYVDMLIKESQPEGLLRAFEDYVAPQEKWNS